MVGSWIRQRVWASGPVRSQGETIWPVRACSQAVWGFVDGPATYAAANEVNALAFLSAVVFDPEDGTISTPLTPAERAICLGI